MLKGLFFSGIILGFAAVLAGAGFYPWVDHPRLVSRTQVLPNGGRREDFFVRLPVDRIASAGTEGPLLGATPFPSGLELPTDLAAEPLQIDHFKVRDTGGNVVGVASRHAIGLADTAAIVWSITLPSRGALWLNGNADPNAFRAGFARIGYQAGEAWSGDLEIAFGPADRPSGLIEGGSKEFVDLEGSYYERWHITGIDESGELRGTIEVNTTTFLTR
jgi:hypothetical protein